MYSKEFVENIMKGLNEGTRPHEFGYRTAEIKFSVNDRAEVCSAGDAFATGTVSVSVEICGDDEKKITKVKK